MHSELSSVVGGRKKGSHSMFHHQLRRDKRNQFDLFAIIFVKTLPNRKAFNHNYINFAAAYPSAN
jgi:hypothetical protein